MTATSSRITAMFESSRLSGQKALIPYLTAGDPNLEVLPELILAAERAGADLIELGIPFSDPIADGPVIQRASARALAKGTSLRGCLEAVRQVRRHSEIPILLFSYLNPLLRFGFERLAAEAADAGVDGVLLTDLSVEESAAPVAQLRRSGLDCVFLAAPTSTAERLRLIAERSSGFVYLVSRLGVTGERASIPASAAELAQRIRSLTPLPLALGFGISTPAQVAEAARLADGVVVGSSIVKLIEQAGGSEELPMILEEFVRTLAAPLRPS